MRRLRTLAALALGALAAMPAVPEAQADTFYRIRTASPTYTGYLADSKLRHPQSLPADIPARALITIQNPVDPAAHWRLSGAPISYRGEWRFRFVNRATGLCLSAYTVVNQGLVPAVRPCRAWDREKWSLLIGGAPLRNMPTPGGYQFKNATPSAVGGGHCLLTHNRLVVSGIPLVIFDFCRTRTPSIWELRPPFTAP
jgi:hypothetical protein